MKPKSSNIAVPGISRLALAMAFALMSMFCLQLEAFAQSTQPLFTQPQGGAGNIWLSIMSVIQIISYCLYIVGLFWLWTGVKDWKDGSQKEAWQKIGGAVGIFLAPAAIAMIRSLTTATNTFSQ